MNNMSHEDLKNMIQLNHPDKFLALYPGVDEECTARIYDIDLETYCSIKKEFRDNALSAAERLLEDQCFKEKVGKLPFKPGQTIVGLGDSITDDYQSWFEILTNVLNLVYGKNTITTVNAGISGETTSQMITRFYGVVDAKPDWIFCLAGTNDSRRHGLKATKALLSPQESALNYDMLLNYAETQTSAKWIWLTPLRVIEEKIAAVPVLDELQFMWKNDDIYPRVEILRQRKEHVIDLWDLLGVPANPELLLPDGLHPSLKGHMFIVRKLVDELVEM